jgi:hypothetical protein
MAIKCTNPFPPLSLGCLIVTLYATGGLVDIGHFPDVQVGNWMDWQPRKEEGEELQSNLTLEEVEKLASEVPTGDDDVVNMDGTIIVDVE